MMTWKSLGEEKFAADASEKDAKKNFFNTPTHTPSQEALHSLHLPLLTG